MLSEHDGDAPEEDRFEERSARGTVAGRHRAERRLGHVFVKQGQVLSAVHRVRDLVVEDPRTRRRCKRVVGRELFVERGSEREPVEPFEGGSSPRVRRTRGVVDEVGSFAREERVVEDRSRVRSVLRQVEPGRI